jgi:hypothetical protein
MFVKEYLTDPHTAVYHSSHFKSSLTVDVDIQRRGREE